MNLKNFTIMNEVSLFWFRRDLRLSDNKGLFHALKHGLPVLPLFIFDSNILGKLENREDSRVTFIFDQVYKLKAEIESLGGSFLIEYGNPIQIIDRLTNEFSVKALFTNKDYETYALKRDKQINDILLKKSILFLSFKDHVIFEKHEVIKDNGAPYTVFTPYSKKWKSILKPSDLESFPSEKHLTQFHKTNQDNAEIPSLKPRRGSTG